MPALITRRTALGLPLLATVAAAGVLGLPISAAPPGGGDGTGGGTIYFSTGGKLYQMNSVRPNGIRRVG